MWLVFALLFYVGTVHSAPTPNVTTSDVACRGCTGHGDCIKGACVCDRKWEGQYCERAVCIKTCGGHGLCLEGFCKCNEGWTGPDCVIDTCPDHCNDRGYCVEGHCKCANGWTGASCLLATQDLPNLGPIDTIGKPKALIVNALTTVVRIPSQVTKTSGYLVDGNMTITINKVCGERLGFAPHTINPQRLIAIPRHGDYVIDGTPRMCTKVILNITYTADGYYGQLAPSDPTSKDLPPPSTDPNRPTTSLCLKSCSGRGTCVNGSCICENGWFGLCCSRPYAVVNLSSLNITDPLKFEPAFPRFQGPILKPTDLYIGNGTNML